jgi:hypothetical protein
MWSGWQRVRAADEAAPRLLDAGRREIRGMGAVGACRGGQARVAEGSNIFGLMVYSAGMSLIVGALTWASYADHRRDKHKQSAKR